MEKLLHRKRYPTGDGLNTWLPRWAAHSCPWQVKDGKTFLDLIAEQVKVMRKEYGSNVKFILMNSFSTSDDTKDFLARAHKDLLQVIVGARNGLRWGWMPGRVRQWCACTVEFACWWP